MPRKPTTKIASAELIERRIHIVRGQRVMLDSDLANLYGVPTHRLNEQVTRNRDRFPEDFSFQLTQQEVANLISQIAISSSGHGGRRKLPWAFTEHGIAMLSSVLNSPTAVRVNIQIIRTFVRMRRLLATPGELVTQLQQLAETVQLHRLCQFGELRHEFARRGQQSSKPHKRSHDLNVDPHCRWRSQHTGKHRHAVFREHPREFPTSTTPRL